MIGLAIKQFIGGNVLWLGVGAAMVTLVVGWDSSRRANWVERGKQEVRVEIEKKSNENATKADAARRAAERLPAGRLCDKYARDC